MARAYMASSTTVSIVKTVRKSVNYKLVRKQMLESKCYEYYIANDLIKDVIGKVLKSG